jgi:hypothetical protein
VGTPVGTSKPEIDPNLAQIIAAWPTLPEPVRMAMIALAESGVGGGLQPVKPIE